MDSSTSILLYLIQNLTNLLKRTSRHITQEIDPFQTRFDHNHNDLVDHCQPPASRPIPQQQECIPWRTVFDLFMAVAGVQRGKSSLDQSKSLRKELERFETRPNLQLIGVHAQEGLEPQQSKVATGNLHPEKDDQSKSLRKELERFKSESKRLEKELKQSKEQSQKLNNQLGESRSESKRLEKELKQSKEQSQKLNNQLGELQGESKRLEKELKQSKGKTDALKKELQQSQEESQKLNTQLGESRDEYVRLEKKLHQSQRELDKLKHKSEQAEAAYQTYRQQSEEKIKRTNLEVASLKSKVDEQTSRLSKMASERMREGNTAVEDLNDPRRPTALVGQWTSLFRCGEYWTAYEKISSAKGEHRAASTLYRVCQVVYESTKAYVNDLTRTLESVVGHLHKSGTLPTEGKEIERLLPHHDERESFLDYLRTLYSRSKTDDASGKPKARKLVVELLKSKSPPASVTEMVDEVLRSEIDFDLGPVKKFTDQLVQLIYYMRSQEVPLMVDFAANEGATFDPSLYDVEGSTAAAEPRSLVIKSVIRPAVLRNEPGPVLSKGEAEVMSRSQSQALNDVEGSTAAAEPRSLVIKSVLRPAVLSNEPGPVLSKGEAEVTSRSLSQAEQGVIGSSPSDITVKPEDPPADAECKDEIDHSHEKTYDISYCANRPLPSSDDEDLNEAKKDAEGEAEQTMLDTDGTRSPASLFSTQTSSTTSRQTSKTGPLVTPTTESLLDSNGIKGSSTGPEDPAETTPKKHCCLRSHDMNPEGDVEQTKNETASPFSDESVDPTSELETRSEERGSHNRSTETETQDESSNRPSDSSMAAGRNQRATHDQNVEVPRENYQETEKQLPMQSADGDCSDQEMSHSNTSVEENFSQGRNHDSVENSEANANAIECITTISSHQTTTQDEGMNSESDRDQDMDQKQKEQSTEGIACHYSTSKANSTETLDEAKPLRKRQSSSVMTGNANDPKTQDGRLEFSQANGSDSIASRIERSKQSPSPSQSVNPGPEGDQKTGTQQSELSPGGKALFEPTLKTHLGKESGDPSSEENILQERMCESGRSSNTNPAAPTDAVGQSLDTEHNPTAEMGNNDATPSADRSTSLQHDLKPSSTKEGAEEPAKENTTGKSGLDASKRDDDVDESAEEDNDSSEDGHPPQDSSEEGISSL